MALPEHHGAGLQRRRAQYSCIGCIGLRPDLHRPLLALLKGVQKTSVDEAELKYYV